MMKDAHGQTCSGATSAAMEGYEEALAQFHCYRGNPVAAIETVIAGQPDFAMAHALRAHLFLSGTEAAGLAPARESIALARRHARTEREKMHVVAADALAAGCFDDAAERFDDILIDHPHDLLALQMGHLLDFYRGQSRNLRDRVLRVLPGWDARRPGWHAVQGMLAFGLEESGDYARAEAAGRQACALEPRDAWAHHAVAHVMEMQGRVEDGIRWSRERIPHWAEDNMMAVHNWWHLALFHLDRDEHDEVLALYDQHVRGGQSTVVLDLIDASAMLWRLHLRGIDPGAARWSELATAWSGMVRDGIYSFNDVHALIGFIGAGRNDLIEQQVATLQRAAGEKRGNNAAMAMQVGVPLAQALLSFQAGHYADTVLRLRPLRYIASRFGGSHAQRDLLDLTLIEAAKRDGDLGLVQALSAERLHAKPASPIAQRYRMLAEAGRAAA